ncbi:LON peptidase N-terminal domain and RING finger protein 1 [Paramormyrops kingsleyae]|uniref:LON peptidase N-terminal domain and RING finger protein 1 n=1 Tax=Paramormyrops kingsleyae TaxID=1676925 RepID=UPI003B97590B
MDLLGCPICRCLMCEPVTVSCGHSFCRRCAATSLQSQCPVCKDKLKPRDIRNVKNNVLLCRIIEKCCPEETELKLCLLERLKACNYSQALRIADDGLEIASHDVGLKVLRAEASAGLQRLPDALQDLDDVCRLHPTWSEGFFRKGNILADMGRQREALVQYHRCLQLQTDFFLAKDQIKNILEAEGARVPEEVPQLLQVVSEHIHRPCAASCSVGPASGDAPGLCPDEEQDEAASPVKRTFRSECCLSQAGAFLPATEDDEGLPRRRDDRLRKASQDQTGQERDLLHSVLSVADFECPLCIRLFHEPVTTPCGHTFCKNCIERSLDHNLRCPLCKQSLHEYLKNRKYSLTAALQDTMSRLFPRQLEDRKRVHEAEIVELSDLTRDVPIFVCTLAFPGLPCPLHVFEPRYRLMMRRCMETGTRRFGMCTYESSEGFADCGCILEILGLDPLPDGRSYVDTVGGSRFRVLSRGKRDGYHTADIEYLEDQKVEGADLQVLQSLHDSVFQQTQDWYRGLGVPEQTQIRRQYGPMPEREHDIQASSDGPAWCWWLLSGLQLDPTYKTNVLSLTSLKDRLGHLRIVLDYLSQT